MNLGPTPLPQSDLASRPVTIIEYGDSIFRTHSIHRRPIHYGKSKQNRFGSPDGSYGVFYAARDPFCAFIETFARAAGTLIVTTTELESKALAELRPERPLRLIDLTQSGALVRLGADSRLFAGDYEAAQRWSKALHDDSRGADGLLYPSRLDHQRHSLALFEDRAPHFREFKRQSWYAPGPQRRVLTDVIEHYGIQLIETRFVVPRRPVASARQGDLFS